LYSNIVVWVLAACTILDKGVCIHMYKKDNVSSRTKSQIEKAACFERNIALLNIIFYIGKGFMLRKQLTTLLRLLYGINKHKVNDMVDDLLSYGLLIKKQATSTQTCLYVITKFSLSQYHNCSSRDTCSIKLNNRKIWLNMYRVEYVIRNVIPQMEESNEEISLGNLVGYMERTNISIYTNENQTSVYTLYQNFERLFPIKDKEAIMGGHPVESPFYNDYYKIIAEVFNHNINFLGYEYNEDNYENYSDIELVSNIKEQLEREKETLNSPKEQKIYYYNLFNMVSNGFFFEGLLSNEDITIGVFDKCNNIYLKKIYENIICIFYMLERYLDFYPQITLNVYMSDIGSLERLKEKENEDGFDYITQRHTGLNKRDTIFKNYKVPRQYWENIKVNYVYYPLREMYNV
jgi:hypothetical protein